MPAMARPCNESLLLLLNPSPPRTIALPANVDQNTKRTAGFIISNNNASNATLNDSQLNTSFPNGSDGNPIFLELFYTDILTFSYS